MSKTGSLCCISDDFIWDFILDHFGLSDLAVIQQEIDALEELSRQLFLETADLHATKVQAKGSVLVPDGWVIKLPGGNKSQTKLRYHPKVDAGWELCLYNILSCLLS